MWYHDHAIGLTQTNAYAGIASALLIIDHFETKLVDYGLLPDLIGIPLIIQDKSFVTSSILTQDPAWPWGGEGNLWYPHVYEPSQLGLRSPDEPASDAGVRGARAFFDTILINGGIYPVVSVPPRRVRFRILNGSQARFFHLNLYKEIRRRAKPT